MKNTLDFLLQKSNITKSEFARDMGVTRQTIIRICQGKAPSLELSLKIAQYFNKDVSDIFFTPNVKRVVQKDIG